MKEKRYLEDYIAGRYEPGPGYRYFIPTAVNVEWIWRDASLNELMQGAALQLGRLDSFAALVPSTDVFIQLHVVKEAVVSSRIEGTETRIDEALMRRENIIPERRDDWQEVANYIAALNASLEDMKTLPLAARLLRRAHSLLLDGVRGKHKQPGAFRTSQNWIGGASLADAAFVPPAHVYINELMADLEKFMHNDEIHVPAIIRAGIAHYQFETIHPFLDGNGRIGRLLITLYLIHAGLLRKPLLYLSAFFEENRDLYYDNLTRVRQKGDLLQWLKYFLVGVEQTARKSAETLNRVLVLKTEAEALIRAKAGRRLGKSLELLHVLFLHPIVEVKDVQTHCQLSAKAAGDMVALFKELNFLRERTEQRRNRLFTFYPYLALFEDEE